MIIRTVGMYDLVYSPDEHGYYWHNTQENTVTNIMSWEEANEPIDWKCFHKE